MSIKIRLMHGMVYSTRPWCVAVGVGLKQKVYRFRTEDQAHAFARRHHP